eukprot:scaffold105299_cov60-Phaeocystis_antarctica.AAC.1
MRRATDLDCESISAFVSRLADADALPLLPSRSSGGGGGGCSGNARKVQSAAREMQSAAREMQSAAREIARSSVGAVKGSAMKMTC